MTDTVNRQREIKQLESRAGASKFFANTSEMSRRDGMLVEIDSHESGSVPSGTQYFRCTSCPIRDTKYSGGYISSTNILFPKEQQVPFLNENLFKNLHIFDTPPVGTSYR